MSHMMGGGNWDKELLGTIPLSPYGTVPPALIHLKQLRKHSTAYVRPFSDTEAKGLFVNL